MTYTIRCINDSSSYTDMGNQGWFQYYTLGVRYLKFSQSINTTLTVLYIVTDSNNNPVSNKKVNFILGKAYSTSNAIVSCNGVTTSGIDYGNNQALTSGITDAYGKVSFNIIGSTIDNTFTQIDAYVNDPNDDIVDIIEINYNKLIVPIITTLPIVSSIINGQSLSDSTLNGGNSISPANNYIEGNFVFTNSSIIPNIGSSYQSITFIPTNKNVYNILTFDILITVNNKIVNNNIANNKTITSSIININIPLIKLNINNTLNISAYNTQINLLKYNLFSSDSSIAIINSLGVIIPFKKGQFYLILTDKQGTIIYTSNFYIQVIE